MTDQERTDWAIAEAFTAIRREWRARVNDTVHVRDFDGATKFWREVDARAAEYAKDAPRADGLDGLAADDVLAAILYVAVVQPELIWFDDLTPDMQEGWRRGARAVLRLIREAGQR